MITGRTCSDNEQWDELVCNLNGHPLQMWGWGELKSAHNWSAHHIVFDDESGQPVGGAQVLVRQLPFPFRQLAYVPRGPVARQGSEGDILTALAAYVREHHPGVVLTIEPDSELMPDAQGWIETPNTILIPRTLILDLNKSLDDLMAAMTKKTRQYIRKSGKEDVVIRKVRTADELQKCLDIYHQTAERAGFALHGDQYYHDVAQKLGDSSVVFAAFKGDMPIAFLWLAISSHTAFELYGGMNDEGQQLRVNYALKWHAITKCREWGIERYDMNGLLNDGVSTFKQGFADHESMLAGTFDYPLSPLYTAWTKGLPLAKTVVRKAKSLLK